MTRPLAVLLAEDEPLASMALRAQIEALGHSVIAAARDGEETLALGQCVPAELAILDMRMPAMTGLDAGVRLFDIAPTPVLLLTGYGASDLPDPVPEPPVFYTLTKPVGLDSLREGIDGAISAFERWMHDNDRTAVVRKSRDARADIADTLHAAAESAGQPLARVALRITEQAHATGRSTAALAAELARSGGA